MSVIPCLHWRGCILHVWPPCRRILPVPLRGCKTGAPLCSLWCSCRRPGRLPVLPKPCAQSCPILPGCSAEPGGPI